MKSAGSIVGWMVATIVAIGAASYWDDQRGSQAALADLAREQVVLARSAAATPEGSLGRVEEPGSVIVLTQGADGSLHTTGGVAVVSEPIQHAIARGDESVRLTRPEAGALGLPVRTALAGIATATMPGGQRRAVVVVATALRERDRERRAQWRLVLSFLVSSAIVLAFGTLALRKQRKELELQSELRVARADKLATLGALGIGIAHEVSTPLGVIVGRAEQLASRVEGDERASRAVQAISEQADRIGKIIRALLTLARGGKATLEHVRPASIVTDAARLVRHRFDQAGVSLTEHVDADLPSIACDPKLFTQVVVNLLLNACDACDENVELRGSAANGRIVFAVTDDGPGISPEDAARATEPFFTTKPEGEGTGLGLAIAHEIVTHHNGTLSLGARRDGKRGTEARVELPQDGA
jgi:two-component system, NtrC family, sensor kinase